MVKTMAIRTLVAAAIAGCGPWATLANAQESTQVVEGRQHYANTCVLCHGVDGKRGEGFQTPIWGEGAFIGPKFVTAQGLIDYMQLMPFNDPSLLDPQQKLAVVAYILANHGTIKPSEALDSSKTPEIKIK